MLLKTNTIKKYYLLILYVFLPSLAFPQQSALMQNMGGYSHERARDIACDQSGNVYVGGIFRGAFGFGSSYLEALGMENGMILKYESTDNPVWGHTTSCYGNSEIQNIIAREDGSVIAVGEFSGSALIIGDTTIESYGNIDFFISLFNSEGDMDWIRTFGGSDADFIRGLCHGPDNSTYICGGSKSDTMIFGNDTLYNSAPYRASYAVQLNSFGDPVWSIIHDEGYDQSYYSVACDDEGNIFLNGNFKDILYFSNDTFYTNGSQFDAFCEKYDNQHQGVWAKHFFSNDYDRSYSIETDDHGTVYLGVLSRGNINIEGTVVSNTGGYDFSIIKYAPEGDLEWFRTVGGTGDEENQSLYFHFPNYLYYAGYYSSNYIYWGQHYVENMGLEDAFYGKVYTYLGAGTVEEGLPHEIAFYPNPFRDKIVFREKEEYIALYSLDGRLILEKEQAVSLDIPADLPPAAYLLKISGNDQTISRYYKVVHQ